MSITERDRASLYDGLAETLGPDRAETLMNMLPGQAADQLVTIPYFQSEMAASRGSLQAEFADFRSEIHTEFTDFRSEIHTEFTDFRSEIRTELADFRTEVKGDVLRVESSLTLRMADLQTGMNRWAIGLTTANIVAIVTALVT